MIIFILLFSGAVHAIKIGAFGGYNLYLNHVSGTTGGVAFGGTLSYDLVILDVGLLSGYFPMYSWRSLDVYTIPVLVYGKFGLGPIYLMGGAGVYFEGGSGDGGIILGGGYKTGLSIIDINIGALYHYITNGTTAYPMLTLLGGIELGF